MNQDFVVWGLEEGKVWVLPILWVIVGLTLSRVPCGESLSH